MFKAFDVSTAGHLPVCPASDSCWHADQSGTLHPAVPATTRSRIQPVHSRHYHSKSTRVGGVGGEVGEEGGRGGGGGGEKGVSG